jgi:hypothetical protein
MVVCECRTDGGKENGMKYLMRELGQLALFMVILGLLGMVWIILLYYGSQLGMWLLSLVGV